MELTPLKRERAVDAVHESLRQAILNSLLKPGERLHVDELANSLGVSLTPVRHAIQLLATEGLVEVKPRSGTFVASVSAEDVSETFDIRCALECLAAEKAVEKITSKALARLKDLLEEMRKPVESDAERRQHEQQNKEFHLTLLQAAGNRRLIEMYDALNANIKIARIHASEDDWVHRLDSEQSEHEEILRALENRKSAQVVKAMRKHVFRARDSLVAAIDRVSQG